MIYDFFVMPAFRGTVIAQAWVGQRDTKWLNPLTVSGGYQGEEGNRIYQALQASHGCSAFYFPTGDCPGLLD